MSGITSYATLVDRLKAWTTSAELDEQIDTFIQAAETDFNLTMRVPQMITSTTLSVSGRTTALPADWMETVSLTNISASQPIPMRFVTNADAEDLSSVLSGGDLSCWSIEGLNIVAVPLPTTAVSVRLAYYQKIPALTSGNTSNWLLNLDPALYLYSCLVHIAPFLSDDLRDSKWQPEVARRIAQIQQSGDTARFSGQRLAARPRYRY